VTITITISFNAPSRKLTHDPYIDHTRNHDLTAFVSFSFIFQQAVSGGKPWHLLLDQRPSAGVFLFPWKVKN
jgi:hypothetical protein